MSFFADIDSAIGASKFGMAVSDEMVVRFRDKVVRVVILGNRKHEFSYRYAGDRRMVVPFMVPKVGHIDAVERWYPY